MNDGRLSPSDVTWIKLSRHDAECRVCVQIRDEAYRAYERARALAPATPIPDWTCCVERKRLADMHAQTRAQSP